MSTIIQRQHLFANLQRDTLPRLMVISAAPGYGKTILAQQLATWSAYPTIWQRIDTWQRDVSLLHEHNVRLWSHQLAAIESELTTEHQDIWQNIEQLFSRLNQQLDRPHLWVVDDVHHLADSPSAERWLQMQIDHLPPQVHILLVGRYLPDLSWTRWVGSGLLSNFDTEHLRFTAEEIQELFQVSEQEALELVTRFDGWIAGIRMAISQQDIRLPQHKQRNGISSEALFAEMAEQEFQQQSPDRQHFLLTSSTLSTFSATICRQIFGMEDVSAHIEALIERNLFVLRTNHVYRYHDLFRHYLQQHLSQIDEKRFQTLHLQAAQWYQAQDEIEEAVSHFVQAEAWAEAIHLAEYVTKEFYIKGNRESLLQFQTLLREQEAPLLQLYCAIILVDRNQFTEAEDLLQQAENGFIQRNESEYIHRVQLQLAFCYYRQGLYHEALAQAGRVLEMVNLPKASQAWSKRIIALAQLELGNLAQAVTEFNQVLDIFSHAENAHERSHVLQDLSSAYLRSGEFEMAATVLQEMIALRNDLGNKHEIALALNNLAYFYHCTSQYQDAIETYSNAMQYLQNPQGQLVGILHWSQADIYRDLGQYQTAEQHYLSALQIALQGNDTLHARILFSFAHLRIWQNRLYDAQILLAEGLRLLPGHEGVLGQAIQILQSLVGVLDKHESLDAELLKARIDKLNTQQSLIKLAQIVGIYLYVAWQQEDKLLVSHAQKIVNELPEHLYQIVAAEIINLPGLKDIAQKTELNTSKDFHDAITKLEQEHKTQIFESTGQEAKIFDLLTLGTDSIRYNGQILPQSAWKVSLARELFYYLYFMGPQTKEEIGLTFWPEHSPRQLRTALHNTLKRLRGAIPDGVIFDEHVYQINPTFHIHCDAIQFRDYIQRARHLPLQDARTEDLYLKAIALYQGDFLPTIFSVWLQNLRDEFQNLYVKALVGVGKCQQAMCNFEAAIAYYNQATDIDLYNESIYCLIMACHAQAGHPANVKQTFDRLKQYLAKDLAIPPQAETRQIFHNLLS